MDRDRDSPRKDKPALAEIGRDLADKFNHWRPIDSKALQDIELRKMKKLQAIFTRVTGEPIPEALELVNASKTVVFVPVDYVAAKLQVTEADFDKKKWLAILQSADGAFKFHSERIVKIICKYQIKKKARHTTQGFLTDPENLFCEEFKLWTVHILAGFDSSLQSKEKIRKRIRYLEETLCEDELFDRPSSRVSYTMQQVIVGVRVILKYHVIPVIDKDLAHVDARKALDSVKKRLTTIIADSIDYTWNIFRLPIDRPEGTEDTISRIFKLVLASEDVDSCLPNLQAEMREKVLGAQQLKSREFLRLAPNNGLLLAQDLIPTNDDNKLRVSSNAPLVQLQDAQLRRIFHGETSGLEEKLRVNPYVASSLLHTIGLILNMARMCTVFDKATACAAHGGTLLVYGIANAQLNAMIDSCSSLIMLLRGALTNLSRIAEVRFEELVYSNSATDTRNPWVKSFKMVHSALAKIEDELGLVAQVLASMKTQANSLTLYEQFQKAQDETSKFVETSTNFSRYLSETLGLPNFTPKVGGIMKVPDLEMMNSITFQPPQGTEQRRRLSMTVPQISLVDSDGTEATDLSRTLANLALQQSLANDLQASQGDGSDSPAPLTASVPTGASQYSGTGSPIVPQQPPPLPQQPLPPISSLHTQPAPVWYFIANEKYHPYPDDISHEIESQFTKWKTTRVAPTILNLGGHVIDLVRGVDIESGAKKRKEREMLRGTWFWQDDDGGWIPYSEDQATTLETRFLSGNFGRVEVCAKPPRFVVQLKPGEFKQYRQTKGGSQVGRDVHRGWLQRVIPKV